MEDYQVYFTATIFLALDASTFPVHLRMVAIIGFLMGFARGNSLVL
jgi:hypothetical protein